MYCRRNAIHSFFAHKKNKKREGGKHEWDISPHEDGCTLSIIKAITIRDLGFESTLTSKLDHEEVSIWSLHHT